MEHLSVCAIGADGGPTQGYQGPLGAGSRRSGKWNFTNEHAILRSLILDL
jgi:hypothetical protein